jgi:hypothetical protein
MSDQPITEATAYTIHDKHRRYTSHPSVGFKHAIPETKQLQAYSLDNMATKISFGDTCWIIVSNAVKIMGK